LLAVQPDLVALERRLGIALGRTLRALIVKAYDVEPSRPSEAFSGAWLYLRWIDPDFTGTIDDLRQPSTPEDVLPIIETGGDLQHFGFLMRRGRVPFLSTSTDKRSVVNILKEIPPAEPFTRNLTGLLCIAATVSLMDVTRRDLRGRTGVSWTEYHGSPMDSPEGREFERASRHLLSIPGVERVRDFEPLLDPRQLTFSSNEEVIPPFEPLPRTSWQTRSAQSALLHAEKCAEHGFPAEAVEFCEIALELIAKGVISDVEIPATLQGMLRGDLLVRTHLLRARSCASLTNTPKAHAAITEALDAWAALPFVHAARWAELRSLLDRLGLDDRALARRLEAHEREASAESL